MRARARVPVNSRKTREQNIGRRYDFNGSKFRECRVPAHQITTMACGRCPVSSRPPRARVPPRWRVGRGVRILASHRDMPPLFDAGVPLEALPWGVEGDAPVSSRSFSYKAEDGETDLEGYFAWDPSLLEGGDEGLPGVLVAHTAIGPQEVFVHTCCDALARMGFAAFALDAFGAGTCVFDKAERDALFGALRADRSKHARRILKAYEAMLEQPEVSSTASMYGIGFCLGGMAVLDLARFRSAPRLRGVVSFHGSLDRPQMADPEGSGAEKGSTSCLLLHGAADPFSSPENVAACLSGLKDLGLPVRLVEFENVKHGFTRPEKTTPEDWDAGFAYDADAAAKSWAMTKTFLHAGGDLEAV